MLYYLSSLTEWFSPLRVFKYITVRSVLAAGTAFLIAVLVGPWVIRQLKRLNVRQYERKEEAPPLHALHGQKEGTPTMGGLLIVGSIVVSVLLWAQLSSVSVWIATGTLCYMAGIGFWDDFTKVARRRSKGIRARTKLILQLAWAIVMVVLLVSLPETRDKARNLMVPFFKDPVIQDIGIVAVFCFVGMVLIGASNAVNLTDGLDGLAIGCTSSVALAYLVMAYAAGHTAIAEYLKIPYVRSAGELAVFCSAMLGASLGFLWYNCHPASVFMGDTGSLALGGAIAAVAILIKQELVLIIVGGVFVVEAVSVILQVVSFQLTGRRIFCMAPLHHHFEMKKWTETQVTIRFWILSIVFALLGVLTLKIR